LRINQNPIVQRLVRLEREMIFWRVVAVAAAMFFSLAFAQEKAQREIRLTSADGRQVVVLSPQGIQLSDRGKKLGEIGFVTVGGDGDVQEGIIKLSGQVLATRMFVQEEKNRLALKADSVAFVENYSVRATLTPDGVMLQDRGGRSKISLTTPQQGVGGLDFVENGNVILALGLNIVVGFAGLLDLGYVAFFAIGSYAWGMVGSTQFQVLTGIIVNPQTWPWLFWPMVFVAALIAAFWGVVLGAPTLRLRGDYLAIVTLGFGEIVPIVFLELDKYTNGTNGIVGVYSPKFPGIDWSNFTPIPYYYLILALIALSIFVNIRLRDSRMGRAWVAIREDEIAAASSGINLANTKLFAFGAGAFFSGVAGAYHAAKLGTVTPDNFSSTDSFIYLAMVVMGGLGSIPGVMVGAFVVYAINEFILAQLDTLASDPTNFLHTVQQIIPGFTFGNIRNLIFGVVLVSIMLFRPEGLIPSARRRRELHRAEEERPEEGALGVVPGAPGFESEVHVE